MRFKTLILAISISIALVPPKHARAADFIVMVDGPIVSESGFLENVSDGDRIVASVETDRSYCCSIMTTDLSDHARFAFVSGGPEFTFPRTSFNGNRAPVIPVASNHPAPERTRFCFASAGDVQMGLEVEFSGAFASKTKAWCEETTLVGTYNLVASDFAYLEMSNASTLHHSNSYDLWVRALTNAPGVNIVGEFNLNNGPKRFDQAIHSFVMPSSTGNVYLLHTGPPNSVFASIAQYEIRNVLPLMFTIVSKNPLNKRVSR